MTNNTIQDALRRPFPREDIEFRVSRVSNKNHKACVLAYITARGIMQRLDEVFGIESWKDGYEVLPTGVKCMLSVKIGKDWVTKEDVAPFTNIEALKGGFSDSLKRSGVKFGIGRYLYNLPEYWVDILAERPSDHTLPAHYYSSEGLTGWWVEPQLPEWAIPDQSSRVSSEFTEKLDSLIERQLLTTAKHQQFLQTLSAPNVSESQKNLIWEQLSLIELWSKNVHQNLSLDNSAKRELYRRIVNSTSRSIAALREELTRYAQSEAA